MAAPCEPSVSVAPPATGPVPSRGPMRMPRRQRWVPNGILAKSDEVVKPVAPPPQYQKKVVVEVQEEPEEEEVFLPEGTPLLTVAGVELPESAVGPALEFLEFCAAFYKPLGMKKIEAEKALLEAGKGCNLKKGGQCQIVQVHVRLLSVILYESDEPQNISVSAKCKSSWLEVLKKYLYKKAHSHLKVPQVKDTEVEEGIAKEAEAECSSKPSPPSPPLSESVASPSKGVATLSPLQESMLKFATALESGADGYQSLAVEEKLQLLNLLCNDVLSTAVLRGHIERVMFEYDEHRREEREKSKAAKKKIKLEQEKQKESFLTGAKSFVQESENFAKLRADALKASTAEPSNTKEPASEGDKRCDAVKTEAVVWDSGARAIWKLKGGKDRTSLALQDLTYVDGIPKEKWMLYSEKDKEVLAAYLNQKKNGRRRASKRYRLKTLDSHPLKAADAGGNDAMEVSPDEADIKQELTLDGDRNLSSSSDDSGSDQESEPESEPEPEE